MPNTYTLIERITVGAAGASSITFTSIPQTYTDLVIKYTGRVADNGVSDGFAITQFNGSSTNFSSKLLYGTGSTTGSTSPTQRFLTINGTGATANTFANGEIYIPNYTSSNYKSFSGDAVTENNGTEAAAQLGAGLWSNTAAITSITLADDSKTIQQYSTFYLYGIAKEGVTPATSSAPYATGGDSIVFDGTYWIHTFTSSGTFTPKKSLTCDYLVVAGGGGGGQGVSGNGEGGGGGAGGLRSTVTATGGGGSLESALSLAANTGYTVTIGAGGSAGSNGSDSVFSSITSTGGGRGGTQSTAPGTGGSGGGGYGRDATNNTGAAGTANQGYAGQSGVSFTSGGGGGAGEVGGTDATRAGGDGVAVSITGSSTFYAGGGGGTTGGNTGGAGGDGGGGNGDSGSGPGAGTANTGGAGGGGRSTASAAGGAGGSGIVIVRYAA
jgi:hypothetical protein